MALFLGSHLSIITKAKKPNNIKAFDTIQATNHKTNKYTALHQVINKTKTLSSSLQSPPPYTQNLKHVGTIINIIITNILGWSLQLVYSHHLLPPPSTCHSYHLHHFHSCQCHPKTSPTTRS